MVLFSILTFFRKDFKIIWRILGMFNENFKTPKKIIKKTINVVELLEEVRQNSLMFENRNFL